MRFFKRLCMSIFLFLTTHALAAPMTEQEVRASIAAKVQEAFNAGDFSVLENMYQKFRDENQRTPSGLSTLTAFHIGLAETIDNTTKNGKSTFAEIEAKIEAWRAKYPESPAPILTLSSVHVAHAWDFRGNDIASKVKKESWMPFKAYVERARKVLEEGKAIGSIDPFWYQSMFTIARAQSWERERFDRLLDEALLKEPLCFQTYFIAVQYLLPHWHGSSAEIEDFALDAVKRTSKFEGQAMYARIYWGVSQIHFEDDLFTDSAVSWPHMKAGFDDLIAKYPDSWNISHYAKFACLAHDKATAAKMLKRLDGTVEPSTWSAGEFDACTEWALSTS